MDDLGQTCNHVDFIERSMKYLKCLHHIEELRYSNWERWSVIKYRNKDTKERVYLINLISMGRVVVGKVGLKCFAYIFIKAERYVFFKGRY